MPAVALVLVGMTSAGCATIQHRPVEQPTACVSDPALHGVWTDARLTQLGPAWVRLSFTPDCRFSARIQLLYARIRETGCFHVQDGAITFERPSGQMRWRYRVAGAHLELEEAPGERYEYRRR
jgi:hypothetical protein